MTQEEKELLIRDLCARLPYGVILNCCDLVGEKLYTIDSNGLVNNDYDLEEVKPYLFPLSSMTEEQKNQLKEIWGANMDKAIDYAISGEERFSGLCELSAARGVIDWLIVNHFDFRGLIPMGSAIDATGLNIY